MANEVARRMSFGSSKQEGSFPMHRYLECLERWSNETPSFVTTQQNHKGNVNWDKELEKLKDYFSKLKFCYIEYETKRQFLEALKKPKDETFTISPDLDSKLEDGKREVQALKFKIAKATSDIEYSLKELNVEFAKFEEERNSLLTELENIKKIIEEHPNAAPYHLLAERDQSAQNYQDVIELGGVEIVENTRDHLLIRMTQQSPTEKVPDYFVRIAIDLKTKQMSEIELTPPGVYYADIAEEAIRSADIRFLIRELQCRIVNYQLIQTEVNELKCSYAQLNNLFTITVKDKITAQLSLAADYPHPHSRVTLVKMENAPKPIVDALKTQINKATAWQSLTSVIQTINAAVNLI